MKLFSGRAFIVILAVCQGLGLIIGKILLLTGALVSQKLTTYPSLVTLPVALIMVGAALCIFWIPHISRKIGIKTSHLLSCVIGIIGTALSAYATIIHSFWLLCVGFLLVGVYYAFLQFYRFLAADTAKPEYKSRAISWVIFGGIAAALLGPELAKWTQGLLSGWPYEATYISITILMLIVLLALAMSNFSHLPRPQLGKHVRYRELIKHRSFAIGTFCGMIAYANMMLIMTSAPLAIVHVFHRPFSIAVLVLQAHFLGMFLPALITGKWVSRYGSKTIMWAGIATLAIGPLVLIINHHLPALLIGLFLVGAGWNFLFIASTTMVSHAYTPEQALHAQGLNNVVIFGLTALVGLLSGPILYFIGWTWLNIIGIVLALIAGLAVLLYE